MSFTKIYHWLIYALFLLTSHSAIALEIIFINPGSSEHRVSSDNITGNFWSKVSKIMQNTAADLNIRLHTEYANRDHILMKQLIRQAIDSKPDYLILVDEKSVTSEYLATINTRNIPIYFLLNQPVSKNLAKLKKQGTNVIGGITPNNHVAGKLLMQELLVEYKKNNTQPANILALHGDYSTSASLLRKQGLINYIDQLPSVNLIAEDVANWSESEGFLKTMAYMQLIPEINIIWCANDAIAFGAKRALKKMQKESAVIVGGINWDSPPSDISAFDISIGGHVLLGAYALINIFDNHAASVQLPQPFKSVDIFEQLTQKNRPLFDAINTDGLANIDFSIFSKTHLNSQEFTLENIISQLD